MRSEEQFHCPTRPIARTQSLFKAKSWLPAGLAAAVLTMTPAQGKSRDRSWLGVDRIIILPRLTQGRILVENLSAQSVCERIKEVVANGAPGPVQCVFSIGDPALDAPGTAVLILDVSLVDLPQAGRHLLFTMRRDRTHGLEPGRVYFGSAPRAVPAAAFAAGDAAVEETIRASLSEILPWLRPRWNG